MLTDQHGVEAGGGQHGGILGAGDAGLGHPHDAVGHLRCHAHGPGGVHGEGDEVALIHADEIGTRIDGSLQLGFVMDLDQCVDADAASEVQERHKFALIERGGDEQHAVGPHDACIAHIMGRHGEVLAQDGEPTGSPGGLQIGDRTAEELDIGEHRETGRTARLVLLGKTYRVEPDGEIALRRRASFDLGNDRHITVVCCVKQGPAETTSGRARERPLDQFIERAIVGGGRVAVGDEDPVEIGAQAGRPLLCGVGVALTIIGLPSIASSIGMRTPNSAPMASLPPWMPRASPSA